MKMAKFEELICLSQRRCTFSICFYLVFTFLMEIIIFSNSYLACRPFKIAFVCRDTNNYPSVHTCSARGLALKACQKRRDLAQGRYTFCWDSAFLHFCLQCEILQKLLVLSYTSTIGLDKGREYGQTCFMHLCFGPDHNLDTNMSHFFWRWNLKFLKYRCTPIWHRIF